MGAEVLQRAPGTAGVAALAAEFGPVDRLYAKGSQNMFASLTRSIAGQQLAIAAAKTIYGRFLTVCKASGPHPLAPHVPCL